MKLYIIIFLFCFSSCNKSKEDLYTLPEETQSGENTLGFKLDNRIWTWNGKYCYNQYGNCRDNPLAIFISNNNGQLNLTSDRVIYRGISQTSSESLQVTFHKNFNRSGVYMLSKIDSLYTVEFRDNKNGIYFGLLPNRETFEINITKLDTISNIISGRFSGQLYNIFNLSDSIRISDGRFDVKLSN